MARDRRRRRALPLPHVFIPDPASATGKDCVCCLLRKSHKVHVPVDELPAVESFYEVDEEVAG